MGGVVEDIEVWRRRLNQMVVPGKPRCTKCDLRSCECWHLYDVKTGKEIFSVED